MIRWCSYCQKFLGEKEPFTDLSISHGICTSCKTDKCFEKAHGFEHIETIKAYADRLYQAGRTGDTHAADSLVREGLKMGFRPVDLMVGFVAPLLYHVGSQWEKGLFSVAQEHQFTSLCERMTEIIRSQHHPQERALPRALLANLNGNYHTLGIRIVSQVLHSIGIPNQVLYPGLPAQDIVELVEMMNPQYLVLSLSMPEQLNALIELHEKLEKSDCKNLSILAGGYPVKAKSVKLPSLQNVTYLSTLDELEARMSNKKAA